MFDDILAARSKEFDREFPADRSQHVTASSIGSCARRIKYSMLGTARPAEPWRGEMTRGHLIEQFVCNALSDHFGERFQDWGDNQRFYKSGDLWATPDGRLELRADEAERLGLPAKDVTCLVEIKSHTPLMTINEPKPEHRAQAMTQAGVAREQSNYSQEYVLLTYVNASDLGTQVFPIKFDPAEFAALKQRADRIKRAASAEALPAEGYIAGGDECKLCPFSGPCGIARTTVPNGNGDALDPVVVTGIAALGRKIIAADAAAEAAAQEARAYKEDLRNLLREHDTRKVTYDGIQVSWSPVAGRKTLDDEALRAAGIDPELYQKVGAPSDRLVVKVISSQPRSAAE
jgi:hypothetical protein